MNGADNLDAATELTLANTEARVKDAQARAKPEQVQHPDGSWPTEDCACGNPLGARLAMGKIRCFECQVAHEKGTRWQR